MTRPGRDARLLLSLGAVIAAVTLSGCGSSALTAKALRTRASLLCNTAIRRSDEISMPSSNSGGATFLARGITVFAAELQALRRLVPPTKLAAAYRASLGDSAQQLDALIATHRDLHDGDDPVIAIKQLDVELAAINGRDRAAWNAVGAPACANQTPTEARRAK